MNRPMTLASLQIILRKDTQSLALWLKETQLEKDEVTFVSQSCHVDRFYFDEMTLTNGFSQLSMPTNVVSEIQYGDQATMKLTMDEFKQLKWPTESLMSL